MLSKLKILNENKNIIPPRMTKKEEKIRKRIVAEFRTCPEIVFEVDCRCAKMLIERDEVG